MSNAWENDDANDSQLVKDLRKQLKEKGDAEKALSDRLAAFEESTRRNALSEAIRAKGLPAKVAELVPANVEQDKLDEWLGNYSDLFGVTPNEPTADDAAVAADAADYDRLARATSGRSGTPTVPQSIANQQAQLAAATTEADVLKLIFGS